MWQSVRTILLDAFFPPYCCGCADEIGTLLCNSCFEQLDFIPIPLQPKTTTSLNSLHVLTSYTNVSKQLLHQLKYKQALEVSDVIASLLFTAFHCPTVDCVTAIPSNPKNARKRGFEPAIEIASRYAKMMHLPFNILLEHGNSFEQKSLNRENRLKNSQHIFHPIRSPTLAGKNILLIDDVYTTGATIESCAITLKNAGVVAVHGLCFSGA